MAKKTSSTRRKTSSTGASSASGGSKTRGGGYQLVIVESPAKAKTIGKYLGPGFVVEASIGHIRDLPSKAPKGSKQPVPGVDLDHDFTPTYEIDDGKKKKVAEVLDTAEGRYGAAFSDVLGSCRVWVNGEPADRTTAVSDADEVAVLPPVSGGC
jgi:DNA topoisomerase-1